MAVTLVIMLSLGQSGYAGSPVEAIHAALSAAGKSHPKIPSWMSAVVTVEFA